MNTRISLEINGNKKDILRYNYCFHRNIDCKGRPTTGILGGDIYVEMESDSSNAILEMLLADMVRPRQSFFLRVESIPVFGRIIHTKDDMMFREITFEEAYLYYHKESMSAEGNVPMITRFLISPTRFDINRTIRIDRRIGTTNGFWWEEYKDEESSQHVVKISDDNHSIYIIDAYWIDENGMKQRCLNVEKPVTLYIKVDTPVVGKLVELSFEDKDSELSTVKYSGKINKEGIIIIDNFKMN